MVSTTPLQQADSLRSIEHGAALTLVQAMHRHLRPEVMLEELWRQAAALTGATGLHYCHGGHGLDVQFGHGAHSASYTLTHQGSELGELTLRFQRRLDDAVLATAEDLLALTMPALRNALAYHQACERAAYADNVAVLAAKPPSRPVNANPAGTAGPAAMSVPGNAADDALVLVSLDGFAEIRGRHGDTWAQTLIHTISQQIDEGLRDADSVFQIDEGLLAVLLPRTNETAALDVAAKIRILIAGLHLRDGNLSSQLTACMGVAGARDALAPEDVLERARAALARAQREGASSIATAVTA